jgi:ankyrin repeat protein
MPEVDEEELLQDTLRGLHNGDFSRLEPRLPVILKWHSQGRFQDDPQAEAEALTCACFNGATGVAEYLLQRGVDPSAGAGTGMDALHWAVNRGQLETVRMLLKRNPPLEARNIHQTTVLGTAVWSALNEPKPAHRQIIQELLDAGAQPGNVLFPTGNVQIDGLLRR